MAQRKRRGRNRFSGMNPVQQRPVGVNPSQGGFFSLPRDERNLGQQGSLPNEEQLNFSHSNASGCGYSNMNHSNFGANPSSQTWSGSQSNVGPQDRVFAGSFASGHSNMNHSNFGHSNMNHSNFGANTASQTWSGSQSNVGPQDRVFAGSYASGDVERTKTVREGRFTRTIPINSSGQAEESCTTCNDEYGRKWCATFSSPCNKPVSCEPCNAGAELIENVDIRQAGGKPCSNTCKACLDKGHFTSACTQNGKCCSGHGGARTSDGRVNAGRQPQKALRTRLGGGRGGSMRRTSRR